MKAVGLVCTPEDLRQAINDRREELGLSLLALDHVSGNQSGYCAKLLCRAAPIKGFGPLSLSALLGSLGLHLVLVANDEAIPRVTRSAMEELGAEKLREKYASSPKRPAAAPAVPEPVPEAA